MPSPGGGWLTSCHDDGQRRFWKVRLIRNLYERGLGREDVRALFRIIDWLMELPKEIEDEIWQEVQAIEQEKQMPFMTKREQRWLEEGIEKGKEKGRAEGLEEGIELALKLKFG